MFDIGISELGLIAVVALLVIGPERLPRVARMIGTLLGRAQRYVNDVKAEVNREIELDELKKIQAEMQDAARGIQKDVTDAGAQMQSAVHDVERSLQDAIPGTTDAASASAAIADPGVPALAEPSAAGPAGTAGASATEPSAAGPAGAFAAVASGPAPAESYAALQEPPGTPPYEPPGYSSADPQPAVVAPAVVANVPGTAADPRAAANVAAAAEPRPTQASLFS